MIGNPELVPVIADLLATPSSVLEKALCYRVVGNKHGAIDKMHTVEQAVYGKDAFAKVGVVTHCGCGHCIIYAFRLSMRDYSLG